MQYKRGLKGQKLLALGNALGKGCNNIRAL